MRTRRSMTMPAMRAMMADYRAGVKISEIASKYGVHESYPCQVAKRMGEAPRGRVKRDAQAA